MNNIWRIIRLIPEYRGRVIAIIASSAALGFLATATPYLFKSIVDTVARLHAHSLSPAQAELRAVTTLSLFAGLRLAVVAFSYLQERQADALWVSTVGTLRQRVFDTMTGLSLDYFERTRTGDVMERFATITTVTMWLFSLSEGTLAGILQMAFGIGALLIKAPLVGLIMLIVIPYNLVASFRAVSKTKPLRRKWNRLVGTMSGLLSELVSQIATVRSFAGEHAVKRRYDAVQEEWEETRRVELDIEQRSGAELNLVNTLAVVAAIALVTLGALRGAMTPGDVLLILTLTQGLITTIQPITRLVNTTGDVDAAAERLVELLDVAPTVLDAPDAVPLTDIRSIEFRDVGFAYPGKTRAALSNVSFTLDAGQSLALVGPSGSGKSTVIKLLMRLYDPTSGVVLINDRDIRAYTQQSLRGLFGVVLQDVALFNDTIAENLGFARPGAPREAVVAAAEAAHADTFIRQLPESYETMVGERGVRLSGGEKQRIAIARALLRDPSLIILDEATSALDSESERLVQEGLNRLMRGRTAIVIAHRLSTIANADKILVMQGGTIVERGSHGALLSQSDGLYARLHALQGTAAALP